MQGTTACIYGVVDMSEHRPEKGDVVECTHPHYEGRGWHTMTVEAPLATQFTVIDGEGHTYFFFYTDKGDTWRVPDVRDKE